jgi:hypothetical protein
MKIKMTKELRFSPNCRNILALDKGQEIALGENGLTKDNLDRLVSLKVAHVLEVADIPVEVEPEVVDYKKITDKDELKAFALEQHDVSLDTNKSLEKMIVILGKAIDKKGE